MINSVLKKITTETDDLGVIMEPEAEEGGCEEEFAICRKLKGQRNPVRTQHQVFGTSISVHVIL